MNQDDSETTKPIEDFDYDETSIAKPKKSRGRQKKTVDNELVVLQEENKKLDNELVEIKKEELTKKLTKKQLKLEAIERGEIFIDPDKKPRKIQDKPRTEKQLEVLSLGRAKGRETLNKKFEIQRENKKKHLEELVVKKASKILENDIKVKTKLKKQLDLDDEEEKEEKEEEEIVYVKPKPKQIRKTKKLIYYDDDDIKEPFVEKPKLIFY